MSDLWVITCYFDAAGYQFPKRNFALFRQKLAEQKIPLLTVEMAFAGKEHVLKRGENHFLLRGHSILWQKERLLNFALSLLPPECRKVAWVDADIFWQDGKWAERACDLLDRHQVIQLFSGARRLFPQQTEWTEQNPYGQPLWLEESVLCKLQKGEDEGCIGFAWAARREIIQEVGLYDRCILGGGDYVFLNGLIGRDRPWGHPPLDRHVARWQDGLRRKKLSCSFLDCEIRHLYHGNLSRRRYRDRHHILIQHDYHPDRDVYQVGDVLEWATLKPSLHDAVQEYFAGRREDEPWVDETALP